MNDQASRITLKMDDGWLFHRGDIQPAAVEPRSVFAYHCMSKANRARGAAAPSWDDRAWEKVTLPHDYAISGEINHQAPSAHGSLARENAWYRMHFQLDEAMRGRSCILEFDGVATKCQVWVNGHLLKRHFGAYVGFEVDFTDVAFFGSRANTVAVYVDTSEFEGWWYEGAGIYRHVRLVLKNPQHVRRWGIYVRPEKRDEKCWDVHVQTELRNQAYEAANLAVYSQVLDNQGNIIAFETAQQLLGARSEGAAQQIISVADPLLWSAEHPICYCLRTDILVNGHVVDTCDTIFGFRTVEFSNTGMRVNGQVTKIRGVCVHEDYGALGTAMPDSLKEYRLRQLMGMGVNGIRCSHNPQSAEQFDLCDRLGLMVMAEARWFESYGEGLEQLKEMIRRDRNHPSIFFWSMGNEEPVQRNEIGGRIMRAMRETVRQLDGTRPCLLSMHSGLMDDGAVLYSDVIGMNYNEDKFELVHQRFPDQAVVGSEMYSTSLDPEGDRHLGLYACEMLDKLDYLTGIYIWTGVDYRGEHIYPTVIANAGAIDLNARPRDDFYLYRSMWTKESMVYIHTHWNHKPGTTVEVYTYSNLDEVEMLLNGRSLGVQKVRPYAPQIWRIPFEAGELAAIARSKACERVYTVRTSAQPVRVQMESVLAEKSSEIVINMTAVDEYGNPCLNDRSIVSFTVEGGRLMGACNGDIYDWTKPMETMRPLYEGFCQLVIKPTSELVTVRAGISQGEMTELIIPASVVRRDAQVQALPTQYVTGWVQSDVYEECPDVHSLEPKDWKPVATDIACSWNFFRHRDINKGSFFIDAWVCDYAQTIVPEKLRTLQFGEYCEGTKICISRTGQPRDARILQVTRDGEAPVFDASDLNPGEALTIYILLYAKQTTDGMNGPVYWR